MKTGRCHTVDSWDESKHPRDPKGTTTGGHFAGWGVTLTETLTGDWMVSDLPANAAPNGMKFFDSRETAEKWVRESMFHAGDGRRHLLRIARVKLRSEIEAEMKAKYGGKP